MMFQLSFFSWNTNWSRRKKSWRKNRKESISDSNTGFSGKINFMIHLIIFCSCATHWKVKILRQSTVCLFWVIWVFPWLLFWLIFPQGEQKGGFTEGGETKMAARWTLSSLTSQKHIECIPILRLVPPER